MLVSKSSALWCRFDIILVEILCFKFVHIRKSYHHIKYTDFITLCLLRYQAYLVLSSAIDCALQTLFDAILLPCLLPVKIIDYILSIRSVFIMARKGKKRDFHNVLWYYRLSSPNCAVNMHIWGKISTHGVFYMQPKWRFWNNTFGPSDYKSSQSRWTQA